MSARLASIQRRGREEQPGIPKGSQPEETGPSGEFILNPNSEAQQRFLNSKKRYTAFVSGIGAGKTTSGIMRALRNAVEWNPGEVGYIVAPNYTMLQNVILLEMERWGLLSEEHGFDFQRQRHLLNFPNGSKIIFESAENDRKIERLRGPSIAWFWLDEAAIMPEMVWRIMIGRMRRGRYRNAFVTTTPKGFNWVYDRFGVPRNDTELIARVPSSVNPALPEDYAEIIGEYKGQFYEQEVLGAFVRFEGLVYPWFDPARHVKPLEAVPRPLDKIAYGVDWGFQSPGCILAIGLKEDQAWILQEVYQARLTVGEWIQHAKILQERWGPGTFWCDPAEPSNIEEFTRGGLDAQPADNSVLPGIQHVAGRNGKLYVLETCQNVINELGGYRYEEDESGKSKEVPLKVNDHAMDALRYCLMGLRQPGPQLLGGFGREEL